jgi:hypothetical protein
VVLRPAELGTLRRLPQPANRDRAETARDGPQSDRWRSHGIFRRVDDWVFVQLAIGAVHSPPSWPVMTLSLPGVDGRNTNDQRSQCRLVIVLVKHRAGKPGRPDQPVGSPPWSTQCPARRIPGSASARSGNQPSGRTWTRGRGATCRFSRPGSPGRTGCSGSCGAPGLRA